MDYHSPFTAIEKEWPQELPELGNEADLSAGGALTHTKVAITPLFTAQASEGPTMSTRTT